MTVLHVRLAVAPGNAWRMATRLGFLAGLATGYVLGTRASYEQRARVDRAIDKVMDLTVNRSRQASKEATWTSPGRSDVPSDPYVGRASA
jgi:hypothetical protein